MRFFAVLIFGFSLSTSASQLKASDRAPAFSSKTHTDAKFDLLSRKGKWTVLYFYPKADTPGCTKQACAFRDSIKVIRALDADVYGISADGVDELAKFHKKYYLNFTLLADPSTEIIQSYGVKRKGRDISSRTTFIIGPNLKIRHIEPNVDPVMDAQKMAAKIKELKAAEKTL